MCPCLVHTEALKEKKNSTCKQTAAAASGSAGFVSSPQFFIDYFEEEKYRRTAYGVMGVLGLMRMSFWGAGCVYQFTSTVPGANSTGLCLATIHLLWSHLKPHPPRGNATLLFSCSHSISLLCSPILISPFFLFSLNPFWLLPRLHTASPSSSPLCSLPLSPSDLIPTLNLRPVRDRGSCELERSKINKARTGWMIYPEKMHFVTRMGTAGHKSCHPGCLQGHACWSSSSLSSPLRRERRTNCKQLRQSSLHQPAKQINPY